MGNDSELGGLKDVRDDLRINSHVLLDSRAKRRQEGNRG